jgi:hypothetical protein
MGDVIDMNKYRGERDDEEDGLQIILNIDEEGTCIMMAFCDKSLPDEAVIIGVSPASALELAKALTEFANALSN